ncbi:MAG: helix-turn-helix domain-containing protein [Candidatus Aenigmarchaeota archaeon]|nr:helix-turn-helix domain-containing protein [Candidatus Aenigmarchaeota archaeon]
MKKGCEDFVNKFLPEIRVILVKKLFYGYGMTQKEIASKLGISQPMVSYLIKKEASKNVERVVGRNISVMAGKILEREDYSDDICKACLKLTKTKCMIK